MKRLLAWLRSPPAYIALVTFLSGVLGALLVAAIFWTGFNLQWIAFLGGVMFAAVVAMATRASRAQWIIARRTKQLERIREQLSQEIARSRNATEGMRIVETRMRLLGDALPTMILYIDREERCNYHNRAVEQKTGLSAERIAGRPLREVVGNAVYPIIAARIAETLSGKTLDYELAWSAGNAPPATYVARHMPYPPDEMPARGFYLLLTRSSPRTAAAAGVPPQAAERPPRAMGDAPAVSTEGDETLYLRSISDELMGSDDPRAKLVQALEANQFLLFAQKIQPLQRDAPEPLCYEILLRLQEEEDHLLPPGGFIPVAEHYGMVEELDRWVVRYLLSWCVKKQAADPAWRVPLYCVNLTKTSITNPDFAKFVRAELQRSRFSGRSLCFEIGEPDIIGNHANVQNFINALKPAGCRFTVDAFGSVKVSFSHLKGLAIDFIKIDGVIIQNILRDPAEFAKARAIITVCRKIGVRTIAEFVESDEMLARLREIGVDYAQGFGVARPGPIAKVS